MIIAFSSFSLLFLQNYGGEAIFRVYLYALPGCAILIAPLATATITRSARRGVVGRAAGVFGTVVMCTGAVAGLQGYYGIWSLNVEHRSQVALFDDLLATIRGPATISSLHSAGFPTRASADYVDLAGHDKDYDMPIVDRWPEFPVNFPDAGQFDDITLSAESSSADEFFVFTSQADDALEYYRSFRPGAVELFEEQFRRSPVWIVRAQDDHTIVYQFRPFEGPKAGGK
jgi:hypothetical protein